MDAVDIFIGGGLGADPRVGEKVLSKVPCSELNETVLGLIPKYFPGALTYASDAPAPSSPADEVEEVEADAQVTPRPLAAAPTLDPMAVHCEADDGRSYIGAVSPGASLLHTALDQGADAPYDCMEGSCGTCAVKIVSGARFLSPPTLAERETLDDRLDEGYRLACQAKGVDAPSRTER